MSIYISELALDRNRLADATFVGKVRVRERDVENGRYNNAQGRNYMVEQIMPTPFNLTMKVDIWAANTEQKLQIIEQLVVLFNPSLELQTNDNYVDWTSLSVLSLKDLHWSTRSIPVGNDSPIDVATLTLESPIWISPPVKVKQLGVITNIITSIYGASEISELGYTNDNNSELAYPMATLNELMAQERITISDYRIEVYDNVVKLLGASENVVPSEPTLNIPIRQGVPINWSDLLDRHPGRFVAGVSKLFLTQPNKAIIGTVSLDPFDNSKLLVSWDADTLIKDTLIDSNGNMEFDLTFDQSTARGRIDAIIDPLTYNPKRPLKEHTDQPIIIGIRYLIIEDIGDIINSDGASAWKSLNGADFIAHANDLIEWNGSQWNVIFDSQNETDVMVWQTNIYTGVQYLWNGVSWVKSYEGVYDAGYWRLEL